MRKPRTPTSVRQFLKAAALVAFLALADCTSFSSKATQPTRDTASFQFEGKPIHPSCILLLSGDLADPFPVVASVDIKACSQSNQFGVPVVVDHDWYRITDKTLTGDGYFQYRILGESSTGVYVLDSVQNGGGSGSFCTIIFARLESDRVFESGKWRNRANVVCCGSYVLGDRDDRPIKIEDDRLEVGKSITHPDAVTITVPCPIADAR